MTREIYIVNAHIVDANGTFNVLSGYPKTFDSRSYSNDPAKALKRAEGEYHETLGAMSKIDSRQLQVAYLMSSDGAILEQTCYGRIADLPDPE